MADPWAVSKNLQNAGVTENCIEVGTFAGEGANLPLAVEDRYTYASGQLRNAGASAVIKSGAGFLKGISLNVLGILATATHLVIFDNTAASGTVAKYIPLANKDFVECDFEFYTGLAIAPVTLGLDGSGNLTGGTAVVTPAVTWAIDYTAIYR